ncbi:MAG: LemA family protein [Candidatus Sungbacteria bacterium]|nr:LemA family protein [bacterium]MDZ4260088.1 LemA family protein [Candidatus Sungbacteria bacterium]
MTITYIILGIIGFAVIVFIGIYNALIRRRNHVEEAWSDIEVQMKRRYDLIPNVVETVKGYATHESSVLENVTKARTTAMGATNAQEKLQAENMLSSTLKTLFAVAENYPDLKANANFLDLQRELADTENKIQSARRFYNSVVRDFNTMIQSFPSNIIAGMFGFSEKEFFDLEDEAAREPVKVSFK